VTVKEMMHLLDGEAGKTADAEQLRDSLPKFSSPSDTSEQMKAEFDSFWRVVTVLCPERHRQEFVDQCAKQQIDNYEIALRLRIPEQYVPRLFEPRYERWLQANT
jgi:hypothetical protein